MELKVDLFITQLSIKNTLSLIDKIDVNDLTPWSLFAKIS